MPTSVACRQTTGQGKARREERTELADIVRRHAEELRRSRTLSGEQQQAMAAILACRTPALGGHLETCADCGAHRAVYHSCRNRHCPKCQTLAKERWLEARRAELLPLPYFHVVFTIPHELNGLVQHHPRTLYQTLFNAAVATLQEFGKDDKHLGGELGITAVLHTWDQKLNRHVHLHCVVTGGALATDGSRWIPANPKFLFPVRALSKVFRGKFLDSLNLAIERQRLPLDHPFRSQTWPGLRDALYRKDWVVYAKRPFGGPEQVLAYLGRYTHRVAISNHRILALQDGMVHFRWRDRADGDTSKIKSLPAGEFLRRFLLHVLPRGFMRIRHFGILANRHRKKKLVLCRKLLGQAVPQAEPEAESAEDTMLRLTGLDVMACPVCKTGRMRRLRELAPGERAPPQTWLNDSS